MYPDTLGYAIFFVFVFEQKYFLAKLKIETRKIFKNIKKFLTKIKKKLTNIKKKLTNIKKNIKQF